MESGKHTKEGMIKDRINLELVENKDTIKYILIDQLPSLTILVNIEGDGTIEGFVVVEKHIEKYDNNSFEPFLTSLKTLKEALISNQFDN